MSYICILKDKENLVSYAFENSISLIDINARNLHNTFNSKIGLMSNAAADKPDHLQKSSLLNVT